LRVIIKRERRKYLISPLLRQQVRRHARINYIAQEYVVPNLDIFRNIPPPIYI
jgi:hypothetical protein